MIVKTQCSLASITVGHLVKYECQKKWRQPEIYIIARTGLGTDSELLLIQRGPDQGWSTFVDRPDLRANSDSSW